MRGAIIAGFVLFAAASLATSAQEECQPCDRAKCPSVKDCKSVTVVDKCGCCLICDKVVELLLEQKPDNKTETREQPKAPVTNEPQIPSKYFFGSSLHGNEDPVIGEDVSIQVIPLNAGVINSAPFKQTRSFPGNMPLLNRILKMFGFRSGTAWPTCGTHDELTSQPEGKAAAGRRGDSEREAERSEPQLEDTITVTRLKVVPLNVLFSNFGRREAVEDAPQFRESPHIRFINMGPQRVPSNNVITRHMIMHERPFFEPITGPRMHNVFDLFRLMMEPHLIGLNKPKLLETPDIKTENVVIRDGVTDNKAQGTADYDDKGLQIVELKLLPSEKQGMEIGNMKYVKEEVASKLPKQDGVFVDSPDFGKKQLDENVVDLNDGKSKKGDPKSVAKVEETFTVRSRRFTPPKPDEVVEKSTTIGEQAKLEDLNDKVSKEKLGKKPFGKKTKLMLSDSNGRNMRMFPDLVSKGSAEAGKKQDEQLTEDIANYLAMKARAERLKAELKTLTSLENRKRANIAKEPVHGNSNSFGEERSGLGNQAVVNLHPIEGPEDAKADVKNGAEPPASEGSENGSETAKNGKDVAGKTEESAKLKTTRMLKKLRKNPAKTVMKMIEAFREDLRNIHADATFRNEGQNPALFLTTLGPEAAEVKQRESADVKE